MPTTWRKSLALLLFAQQVPCKVSFNDTSKKVSILSKFCASFCLYCWDFYHISRQLNIHFFKIFCAYAHSVNYLLYFPTAFPLLLSLA